MKMIEVQRASELFEKLLSLRNLEKMVLATHSLEVRIFFQGYTAVALEDIQRHLSDGSPSIGDIVKQFVLSDVRGQIHKIVEQLTEMGVQIDS